MVTYVFIIGDRVRLSAGHEHLRQCRDWQNDGVVTSMVPGNGSIEWYYVEWNDGTGDLYTRDQLTRI